jgi:hypothetical protein
MKSILIENLPDRKLNKWIVVNILSSRDKRFQFQRIEMSIIA